MLTRRKQEGAGSLVQSAQHRKKTGQAYVSQAPPKAQVVPVPYTAASGTG